MKILAPIKNPQYLSEMAAAGADEFYIGFYDDQWTKHFGHFSKRIPLINEGKPKNPYGVPQRALVLLS